MRDPGWKTGLVIIPFAAVGYWGVKKAQPKMLTVKQAAQRLGAAESSVRMWVRRGRFVGARIEESPIGAYWLIPEDSLDDFEMGRPGRKPKRLK